MAGINRYRGLAVNGNYLYQHRYYSFFSTVFWGIARTDITTKTRANWKDITETAFINVEDMCGDATYLYVMGETKIISVNYSGVYAGNFAVSDIYSKIYSDGTNLYLNTSSKVDIYTVLGTFIRSITVADIQSVAVKDSDIYIITDTKIKKYNSSSVFQEEFDITGTITDAVII